ncbi:unnamed protein product [Menidia menidia]|uniref:(Atlantic silverside) hypothetical protein n=1 Tax=Menidia menidia TaxID=238744 RepID=A0A8S4AHW1_9TELE|nr:unnamed protein product [Menidia menidia]
MILAHNDRFLGAFGSNFAPSQQWAVQTALMVLVYSGLYDLLTSPDCLPDLLQGGLREQGAGEAFILASFTLQPRTGTAVFGLHNPRDNSKYFEFTVMGKLNRGEMGPLKTVWGSGVEAEYDYEHCFYC